METKPQSRAIAVWLLICCALVFAMVVLGGVTRLTHSGLSMVDWDPIMGIVPPLTEADWQKAFARYREFPEYQKVNAGMTVHEFKQIYYIEYAHRVLGRVIGLVFLVPFLFFWVRRRIPRTLMPKLVFMFVLGGLQGLMGWYMVMSGLVDVPSVSPYRLTAHLLMAVFIYMYMFWVALGLLEPRRISVTSKIQGYISFTITLVVVMIATGGFVAGTKAGFAFNTFPLMHGKWVPDGLWVLQPGWRNFFETIPMVQFIHRHVAYLLVIVILIMWFWLRRVTSAVPLQNRAHLVLLALALQVTLGIVTLVHFVPLPLAAAHQAGALIVLSSLLYLRHGFRPVAVT